MNKDRLLRPCMAGCGALLCGVVAAAELPQDLAELSLEQLMNITVTSVSRKEERQFDAAAAVSALSHEALARSGAGSVAEALRLVPGMQAAAVNAHQWAISSRGFNNLYADKLLVLVDGRAVYTPQFAGVHWDLQQIMLDDVDRIEAIRGPGGTLWGANAVNGVVNVVSLSARDTQGTLLYGGGGDVTQAIAGARHGGSLGDDTWYRAFASYRQIDDYPLADGRSAGDAWSGGQGGFRIDGYPRQGTRWTWQGDATYADFDGGSGEAYNLNSLGRWAQRLAGGSELEVQAYYDRTHRDEPSRARSTADTADLAMHHLVGLGRDNELIWGLGYRHTHISGETTNPMVRVHEKSISLQLFSAFVQDEQRLLQDRLTLTAGIKFEHNDFTGVELQPSVRAMFAPDDRQRVWGAISRAVRTPDLVEGRDSIAIVRGPPIVGPDGNRYVPVLVGNPDIESEVLWAHELGYRIRLTPRVTFDTAAFYNDYSDVIAQGQSVRFVPGSPVGSAEVAWANNVEGETYGGEIVIAATPLPTLRLSASYALLIADLSGGTGADTFENGSPKHQASLGSSWDFSDRASVSALLRYVSPIESVPEYVTADLRLAHRPRRWLELSVVGQNLLDDQHPEQASAPLAITAEAPRVVMGRVGLRF